MSSYYSLNLLLRGKGIQYMDISEVSYKNIIDALSDGLYITDVNRKIVFWNSAAQSITGFSAEEVIGKHCSDNILTHIDDNGNKLCLSLCPLALAIQQDKPQETHVYLHHKNGQRVPVLVKVRPLYDNEGSIIGAVELFSDYSKQKIFEEKLKTMEQLALIDTLIQIPNRRYLEQQLHAAFEQIKRYQIPFGFIFLDIDNFKTINDTYGHSVGDQVLKYVASTLQNLTRPFDTAALWGGDEFALIVYNVTISSLSELANRIRMLIENSYYIHDLKTVGVTISSGATLIREADSIETLIERADRLLYTSKHSGKNYLTVS